MGGGSCGELEACTMDGLLSFWVWMGVRASDMNAIPTSTCRYRIGWESNASEGIDFGV